MDRIEINVGGRDFVFSVKFEHDADAGTPWENSDGHGPVSDWTTRGKRPGELVLNTSRHGKRYYDFAEAVRMAMRESWDTEPYNTDQRMTRKQQAARAARADYEYLRSWCNDAWEYVGVIVTLLDEDGEETSISDSLWSVETLGDYHHEQARLIADELACGFGVRWDRKPVTKEQYVWM